jgi:hypothetical protein
MNKIIPFSRAVLHGLGEHTVDELESAYKSGLLLAVHLFFSYREQINNFDHTDETTQQSIRQSLASQKIIPFVIDLVMSWFAVFEDLPQFIQSRGGLDAVNRENIYRLIEVDYLEYLRSKQNEG